MVIIAKGEDSAVCFSVFDVFDCQKYLRSKKSGSPRHLRLSTCVQQVSLCTIIVRCVLACMYM